ncbi:hypothetical protein DdX_15126 [Ditylenchus destructor]|uniref:Uncharacterized protein n=1 Tax=Ditylenchus destructor TaxID=166010 RepID=A0AAD4MT28_9BILA|nr:hypothetical protein DdX_15126 [Ditylenchus destructor]
MVHLRRGLRSGEHEINREEAGSCIYWIIVHVPKDCYHVAMICIQINAALLFVSVSVMINVEAAPHSKFTQEQLDHNKKAEDNVDTGATNAQGQTGLYGLFTTDTYDASQARQTSWDPKAMEALGLKPFELAKGNGEVKFVEGAKFTSKPINGSSAGTKTQQIGGYTVSVADYRNRGANGY